MLKKVVFWGMMISCILGITMAGPAQAAIIPNGDFEDCNLSDWNGFGNTGIISVTDQINGNCSGYVSTGGGIGGVCSWLYSDDVYPTYVPKSVTVKFKLKYVTQEATAAPNQKDDPFHAILKFDDGMGDVTLITVSTNGVSAAPGFSVQDLNTGAFLPARSDTPWSSVLYPASTFTSDVLQVTGTIPYNFCYPVNIRFDICNAIDALNPSFGEMDDVDITFVNAPGATGTWWKTPGSPVLCP